MSQIKYPEMLLILYKLEPGLMTPTVMSVKKDETDTKV